MLKEYVFISSTFDEQSLSLRNSFRNEINARLNYIIGQLGGNIYLYDYVMGIPTKHKAEDESKYATRVLHTCFETITKSQHFIFILSDNYGTIINSPMGLIPEGVEYLNDDFKSTVDYGLKNELSVLELELMIALQTEGIKCIFCIDVDDKAVLAQNSKLISLREKALRASKKSGNVLIKYSASEIRQKTLRNKIVDHFEKLYHDKIIALSPKSDESEKIISDNLFFANKSRYYVENIAGIRLLDDYFANKSNKVLVLRGSSGSGKSTLLTNWISKTKLSYRAENVIFISCHIGTDGNSLQEVLQRIYENNQAVSLKGTWEIADEQMLAKQFYDFIHICNNENMRTLIVIDGLNQITHDGELVDAYWWLPKTLPSTVKMIVSTVDDVTGRGFIVSEMPSINLLSIIKNTLTLEGKQLEFNTFKKALEKYSVAHEELPILGRVLCSEIIATSTYGNIEAILADYLSYASNTMSLYMLFISRLTKYFLNDLAKEVLTFIWCAKDGLSVEDIYALVKEETVYDFFYLIHHEFSRDADGRLKFFHEYIKEATQRVFEINNDYIKDYRKRIVELCKENYNTNKTKNVLCELAHQIYILSDSASMQMILGDFNITYYLYNKNNMILVQYTNLLEDKNKLINDWKIDISNLNHVDFVADYCKLIGNYNKSLEWHLKALTCYEKTLSKEHPDTATIYNNIAVVYYSQGNYLKALKWYQRALDIREKILGREHPDTATIYNNIALVYDDQGDYLKALEWYQKALNIREKILGKEHPNTAITYNNIAVVYSNQGDYPKSLKWHQKALNIREKILGKEHPNTATTYNNIATVYDNQGNYAKALKWYQKDLVISEKVLGKEHPHT